MSTEKQIIQIEPGTRYTPQALPDVPEGRASWEDWLAEKGYVVRFDASYPSRPCWYIKDIAEVSIGGIYPTYPAALAAAIEHGKGVEDGKH